jgi:hypothetical protein
VRPSYIPLPATFPSDRAAQMPPVSIDQRGAAFGLIEARQRRQRGFDTLADNHDRLRWCQPDSVAPCNPAHLFRRLYLGLAGAVMSQKGAMHPDNAALDVLNAAQHDRKCATTLPMEERWGEPERGRRRMLNGARPQVDLDERANR